MRAVEVIQRVRANLFRPYDACECYRDDIAAMVVWHHVPGTDVEEGVRRVMKLSSAEARYLWAWTQDGDVKGTWAAKGLAIMFAGDWTPTDRRALESGSASVAGVWGTFANRPSLTVKKVSDTPMGTQSAPAAAAQVVRIDRAAVNPASIGKFTSATQKVHVTYTFTVNGKTYQGVVYAGTWTSATLDALRAGMVTLYGTWSSFEGKPSFVTRRVDR